MRTRIAGRIFILLAACFLLFGSVSFAQTDAEINSGIQFNFSTPGARSLGLGGAFLGLADDATAAYTNPAGLVILSKPEVSIEGRRWRFENRFTDRGHAFGDPTGQGTDTISGLRTGTAEDTTNGLSYASFVYPRERWALSVYRHEVANFQTSFNTQGAFFSDTRLFPIKASMDLQIVNLGFAGAFRVTDALSLGADVSSYSLDLDSITRRYNIVGFEAPNYADGNVVNSQRQEGDEQDAAVSLGFLWKMSSKASLGGVYRQGPEFRFITTNNAFDGTEFSRHTARFKTPDIYGLGISYRPTDSVTIAVDYDRVKYSSLTENSIDIFFPSDEPEGESLRAGAKRLTIDDANEIHLGFEYIFARQHPVAIRLGGWYDPDHKIRFQGNPGDDLDLQSLAVLFRPGRNEIHYSAGLGFVFGQKFQLDLAVDRSKQTDTGSVSTVFRF